MPSTWIYLRTLRCWYGSPQRFGGENFAACGCRWHPRSASVEPSSAVVDALPLVIACCTASK